MPKEIRLNAFDMNCVSHIQHGMWAHPRDRSMEYTELDYWIGQARTLERGLFDGLFIADIIGVYDVFAGSADASIRGAVQIPVNEPTLLVPAMAHATKHLGFGVTANLTYETPYGFARRFSTLDHLTHGRIGWNIVTGYLDHGARGMGRAQLIAHDDRYDIAGVMGPDEYHDGYPDAAQPGLRNNAYTNVMAPGRVRPRNVIQASELFQALARSSNVSPGP